MDEVEEYKYSPSSPRAGHYTQKTGAPDAVNVAPHALHQASCDTQRLTVLSSDRAPDATSERPLTLSSVSVKLHPPWV